MQYVISVLDNGTGTGTDEEMGAIDAFNDSLEAEGRLVFLGGLAEPRTAAVLDNRDGKGMVTDGPFVELSEYVSGLWIVEAADRETALRLAAAGSRACNRKVELRQLMSA
ncbi:YciI family protein [Amnibacterium sp.]|uniref:YciI family protein n=1 Tax=Amnibacterium sp. TaxID=1872496 RepID=UPI00260A425F|nr:YciI family protein [Amnibacterium sp.]MCU1472990.1 YCII-like protein [Amnibacterium sp.]